MNMRRLELMTYSFNKRAIKTFEKVGFKQVGKFREALKIYSKNFDIILMDLLKEEAEYGEELIEKLETNYKSLIDKQEQVYNFNY